MLVGLPLPLSYPLRRNFTLPAPWMSYALVFILLGFFTILVLLNMASQGYQQVSVYDIDHNKTKLHWYNHFTPAPKNGSQCQPHIFSVGDTFTTYIGVFLWSLGLPLPKRTDSSNPEEGTLTYEYDNPSPITAYGQYSGSSLGWCDVEQIQLAVDAVGFQASVTAMINCWDASGISAITSVTSGFQIGETSGLLQSEWLQGEGLQSQGFTQALQEVVSIAGTDALNQLLALTQNDTAVPTKISVVAFPDPCPGEILINRDRFLNTSGLTDPTVLGLSPWCSPSDIYSPPNLNVRLGDAQIFPYTATRDFLGAFNSAINNAMQSMLASVRYDLGNLLPNNYLTNGSAVLINNTFSDVPASDLFMIGIRNGRLVGGFTHWPGVPTFSVTYLCRFAEWKSPESAVIAVLVATLSIASSAWGAFMFVVAFLVKRRMSDADACEYHRLPATPNESQNRLEEYMKHLLPTEEKV